MSRRDIAALAFTITGLYALIEASGALVWFLWMILAAPGGTAGQSLRFTAGEAFAMGIPNALLTILGCALIFGRRRFAARVFPDTSPESPPEQRFLAMPALAYSVVGLCMVALSLPALAGAVSQIVNGWSAFALSEAVHSLLLFAVGVALFLGSHGLARVWSRLRYSGLRRQMGLCVHCGYELTGNVSGVCPECGTPVAPGDVKQY